MVSIKSRRKPSAIQTPNETRQGNRGRTSGAGRAAGNVGQHPEAGTAPTKKTALKRYLIVIEKANGNFGAHAPDLPGCGALGETIEETLANMKHAIEMHVRAMQEDGDEIPEPTSIGQYIEVSEPREAKTS